MAEIVWRSRAARHLVEIFHYLQQRSPRAAERYSSELRKACDSLSEFPEKAARYDKRYRALVFRNHLVLYHFDRVRDKVIITAIIDSRRDVKSLLRHIRNQEP